MPPLYSGSADEWSYISNDTANSDVKTVDFIIDNFEAEMMKSSHILKSNPFTVKHSMWHIAVHLGRKEDKVGVFIQNDNSVNLRADGWLKCGNVLGKLVNQEVLANNGFGWEAFLTTEACKKILTDGKLKVSVEIKLIQEKKTVICAAKPYLLQEASILNRKIFETMAFSDFKVICNGKIFPCHKVFLAAGSSVFKNMLEADMKEAKEGSVEILNHADTVVSMFVKFFYTHHVEDEVLRNHAINFFDLGEQYQMEGLKKMAEVAMIANLSTKNMLEYLSAGDMFGGKELKEAAKAYIKKNRKSLVKLDGWRDAVKDRELLLDLIESLSSE